MEDRLDDIIPDIPHFCELLIQHLSTPFVLNQLLQLAGLIDLSDESGRRKMSGVLRDVLCKETIQDQSVELGFGLLRRLETREDEFTRIVLEVR